MFSKSHIVSEIKRTAKANNGSPLGVRRFQQETGIRNADWEGKYWARWGDALVEAGFEPLTMQVPRAITELLSALAQLTRKLGRFPVRNEIRMERQKNTTFPTDSSLRRRLGPKEEQLKKLAEYAKQHGLSDVEKHCAKELSQSTNKSSEIESTAVVESGAIIGYVYLLKSGKYYKIGRTSDLGRREYDLRIQLPEKPVTVHSIKTDDPVGIERYWHERFKERRKNGEWFELTKEDVAAFKRRKFM